MKEYKIDKEDISRVSIPIKDYIDMKFKSIMYDKIFNTHIEYRQTGLEIV